MAAYAAVASLLNNIDQIMNHPRFSTSLDLNQIQSIEEKAGLLLDFIEGYSNRGLVTEEAEYLERQITSVAHAAEDVIESHIVDQIRGKTSYRFLLNILKQIRGGCSRSTSSYLLDLQRIIEDMDAVLKRAYELKEKEGLREDQSIHSNSTDAMVGLRKEQPRDSMVGFEDDLIQLMDELTNQQSSRNIISIVGMGGVGKTTLAENLYQNLLIKQYFDIRAWITVSQQYNLKEIISRLLSSLGISSNATTVDEFGEVIHKTLSGRRYLIVLDDLWSVQLWDELRHFLPDNGSGSRVVLTTRLSNVARDCHSLSCLMMKPLDEQTSWKLFCKEAFKQENCPYPELEEVGKEIARLCRGLPLSTVVIGGLLLNSPKTLQFWENVARNIKSNPNAKEKEESLNILSLSYNHLPPHLKPCFLYMGVFEEDSEIRVPKIIELWIAEGFLRPKDAQVLDKVAESYLKELIDRNLVSVRKHRHNGKIGSCGIHDLVRDLCLKLGEQQGFFHVSRGEIQGKEYRHICSDYIDILQQNGPLLARSIFSGSLDGHLNHLKLLRVLNLKVYFGRRLYENVNLRYLAYIPMDPYQSVRKLPSSISHIWNLQSLILLHSSNHVIVAPSEIWNIRQLRHVKCFQIYIPNPPQSNGLVRMDNLQTLTKAVNMKVSEEVCNAIPNTKKLHLLYSTGLKAYDDSLIECLCNLDRLDKLESLKLSIEVRRWPTRYRGLNKVVGFPISLNKLSFRSGLRPMDKILRFPSSLNKLSLEGCHLGWEDMWMIGSLPQLQVLHLRGYSVGGRKWSPVEGQFLCLKFLKIEWCHLQYWDADSSHFPVLEKLILSGLWYLGEIPLGIGELPTLELIHLSHCSKSAAVSAVRIKEDEVENQGNDALRVQLTMSQSDMKGFKEMVEIEGLTITHVQLEELRDSQSLMFK